MAESSTSFGFFPIFGSSLYVSHLEYNILLERSGAEKGIKAKVNEYLSRKIDAIAIASLVKYSARSRLFP